MNFDDEEDLDKLAAFDYDISGPLDEPDYYPEEVLEWAKSLLQSSYYIKGSLLAQAYIKARVDSEAEMLLLEWLIMQELLFQLCGCTQRLCQC